MSGINQAFLIGHIGERPFYRKLNNNTSVISFPLATSEVAIINGVFKEFTEWHSVIMWRGIADQASSILHKGMLIYVEGKIRNRYFEDKIGIRKKTTEILVDQFLLLGKTSYKRAGII